VKERKRRAERMIIEIHTPELEDLIRDRMASGEYQNVEDVLMQALKAAASSAAVGPKSKKRLGQFLLESPLRDSGLKLDRKKDHPRSVEL
jgi:hypothetical protein